MCKITTYSVLLFSFLILFSCKNEIGQGSQENLKLSYAPMEVGKYWVYQNDSIIYDMGGAIVDTSRSYSRELITEKYIDQAGDSIYRIERFYKSSLQDNWVSSDIWTCQKTISQYIRTEENIKFIKLIFPPSIGSSWDGNKFFDDDIAITVAGEPLMAYRYWDYEIEEPDTNTFGGVIYDELIKVKHILSIDPFEYRESYEHYADGVGMVQRKMVILDAQCDPCPGNEWTDWAESGFILDQILIESN